MIGTYRAAQANHEDGFTLVELLVVIIVIGILAAIAIPVFMTQRGKAYDAAIKSDLRNASLAEEAYLTDYGTYSAQSPVGTDLTDLGFRYSTGAGSYQSGVTTIVVKTDADNGFCLTTTSASGNVWVFDSENGGLQPANGACSL